MATILFSPYKRNQIPSGAQCVQTAVKVAEPPQASNKLFVVAGEQKLEVKGELLPPLDLMFVFLCPLVCGRKAAF